MNGRAKIIVFVGMAIAPFAVPGSATARTTTHAPVCTRAENATVRGLFDTWNKALRDKTDATVIALYAEDATLLPTLEVGPYSKGHGLEAYFHRFTQRKPLATIDEATRTIVCGRQIVYDTGVYSFQLQEPEETAKARYTFIYRFDGKKWQIVHHHSSVAPPSKP